MTSPHTSHSPSLLSSSSSSLLVPPGSDSSPDHLASNTLIYDHILTYPGTYEMPLRTMYTLNSTPRAQPSRPATPTGPPASPMVMSFDSNTAQFQHSIINQVSSLPQQPCSLPPSFITSFLRRCFPAELTLVDFPQALTALDYLKDLEMRRRREFRGALERLHITIDVLKSDEINRLFAQHPGFRTWFESNGSNERKVEAFYTQLFVALRRWILINELSLEPFSKHNCLAMLNTLYPPFAPGASDVSFKQPTAMLTQDDLKAQRVGFFEWIKKVESSGPDVLEPLMQQGKRSPHLDSDGRIVDDSNGWPAVRDCLDSYLRTANAVIEDCRTVESFADFDNNGKKRESSSEMTLCGSGRDSSRSGRKADSGVSFNSSEHQGKRPSTSSSNVGPRERTRGRTSDQHEAVADSPTSIEPHFPPAKSEVMTAMEKVAREFRKIRLTRPAKAEATPKQSKSRPTTPSPGDFLERTGGRRESTVDERPARPRSRASTFMRSLSRTRTRTRPATAMDTRSDDDDFVPPTPVIPASFMEHSDDDDERGGRSRLRRSLSIARGRSNSRGGVLRRMKSLGDTKERGRENERLFGSIDVVAFDPDEMKQHRQRWEAAQQQQQEAFPAHVQLDEDYIIGEAV